MKKKKSIPCLCWALVCILLAAGSTAFAGTDLPLPAAEPATGSDAADHRQEERFKEKPPGRLIVTIPDALTLDGNGTGIFRIAAAGLSETEEEGFAEIRLSSENGWRLRSEGIAGEEFSLPYMLYDPENGTRCADGAPIMRFPCGAEGKDAAEKTLIAQVEGNAAVCGTFCDRLSFEICLMHAETDGNGEE